MQFQFNYQWSALQRWTELRERQKCWEINQNANDITGQHATPQHTTHGVAGVVVVAGTFYVQVSYFFNGPEGKKVLNDGK